MDTQIRTAAFAWLEQLNFIHVDVLRWEILHKRFDFVGQRIIPIGAAGIGKPKVMEMPMIITISTNRSYNDKMHFLKLPFLYPKRSF
jgi:hypothetical protein